MKLRDKFWLWGHPEGRYNNEYGNTGISRMTPMEACLYLGVRNTFMVPVQRDVNRRQYNKSFKTLRQVGWEAFDMGGVEELIKEAADFPNIGCVVYDDFVWKNKKAALSSDSLHTVRERLHDNEVRPLDMWMVLYTHEFGVNREADVAFKNYTQAFDGVIMWTWRECDVPLIPEKYEAFKILTENRRRMFGCYLWNFGEEKPATGAAVKWQLDWYREKLYANEAEGVVLHTNTMADLDLEAYDVACAWMDQHGDEEID
jgi:hypothetical protein